MAAGLVPNTFPYTPDFFTKMTSKLQEYKDTIERHLNDKNSPWAKYFEVAEKKSGVSRVYIFLGKSFFFLIEFIYIFSNYLTFILSQGWSHSPVYI